jgi:hypothetical protein
VIAARASRNTFAGSATDIRALADELSAALVQAMLRNVRGRPSDELLRQALRDWAFVVPRPEPRMALADVRLALRWVERASRPLADLTDPVVMRAVM